MEVQEGSGAEDPQDRVSNMKLIAQDIGSEGGQAEGEVPYQRGAVKRVVSRVLWKMKMAYSPGDILNNGSRGKAGPGGIRREKAYHESRSERRVLG